MATLLSHRPDEPRAVGAKQLCNGGIVYELNNLATAQWIRKEKLTFMDGYGGMLIVRE